MKYIIIVTLFMVLVTLMGCTDVYNLGNFVMPDDVEFIEVIESLDTPKKACEYMEENFTPSIMKWWKSYSPYLVWLMNIQSRFGDCNDCVTFLIFAINYHEYECYQIALYYTDKTAHMIAVFVENDKYNYSSNYNYRPIQADTFEEVIDYQMVLGTKILKHYIVYDYYMNVIERGK